jgi:hypothetical protein
MTTFAPARPDVDASRRAAFRPVLVLLVSFVAVSAAMIAALIALSTIGSGSIGVGMIGTHGIDPAIWIRCSIVLGSSIVLLLCAVSAARGSRRAWLRLRIISAVVVIAIAVIVALPDFLPGWVRIEQAICGALVLPVAILVNRTGIRAGFGR